MASTLIIYSGTGSQTDFAVPFDYLKKTFVVVSLQGTTLRGGDYGDTGADYYFIDKTNIRLKTAPASGKLLTIRRYTSATERIVTFKDASVLKATDLDTSQLQAFHIAEEARDIINDALIQDKFDNWDAKNHRIVNVADPVDPQDAVTYKVYKEDAQGAYQSKLEAQRARDLAKQWATKMDGQVNGQDYSSKYYADRSSTSAKVASDAETQAKEAQKNATAQAADAKASASTATTKASEASASATKAKTSETNAKTSETNAKASETKAKTSQTNAKASETNAKASQDQATRQAQLAKDYANQASDGQIQADWAQSDSSEKSYIRNKPNLDDYVTKRNATIYDTLSIASVWPDGKTQIKRFLQLIQSQTPYNATVGLSALGGSFIIASGQSYDKLKNIWFTSPNALLYNTSVYGQDGSGPVTLIEPPLTYDKQITLLGADQDIVLVTALQGDGYKTFQFGTNGAIYAYKGVYLQDPSILVSDSSTKPSSNRFFTFAGTDKNNDHLGVFQTAVRNTGATDAKVRVFKLGDKSQFADLSVGFDANGDVYSVAPNPPDNSNDTNIATTSFTNKKVDALKTSLTGGSVKVSKATTADTANAVDWDNVTGRPDVPKAHVVETYSGGGGWYRVWSDGLIEQAGWGTGGPYNSPATISLLKPFKSNTNYAVVATVQGENANYTRVVYIRDTNKTVSSFQAITGYNGALGSSFKIRWYASGYN